MILVLPGGQSFVQRQTPERLARDARRIAGILPPGEPSRVIDYAALDALDAPARLLAISYGGLVALRFAATKPSLVSSLVLVSSAYRFSAEGERRVQRQIDFAARADFAGLVGDFTNVFRRGWLNALVKLRVRTMRSRLAEGMNDSDVIVRGLRAVLDAPLELADLARITARTLIVGGTRDQFFGDGRFEETAAAIPNAELALFPDETHMVAVERRRDVAAKIASFLASTSTSTS